jgi:hypothetical protein
MFRRCQRTLREPFTLPYVKLRGMPRLPSLSPLGWRRGGSLELSSNSQILSWCCLPDPQKFCRSFRGQGVLKKILVVNFPDDRTSTLKRNQSVNAQNRVLSAHMVSIFVDAPDLKAEETLGRLFQKKRQQHVLHQAVASR